MQYKEALKQLKENENLVYKRVYSKDSGKPAVASHIYIWFGLDEPRNTEYEAYKKDIYSYMWPYDERVIQFLEDKDCHVELRVGFDGDVWNIPLYMYKNMFTEEKIV